MKIPSNLIRPEWTHIDSRHIPYSFKIIEKKIWSTKRKCLSGPINPISNLKETVTQM